MRTIAATTALLSVLLASCASTGDGDTLFGFNPTASGPASSTDFSRPTVNSAASAAPVFDFDEDDPTLPDAMTDLPPTRERAATEVAADAEEAQAQQQTAESPEATSAAPAAAELAEAPSDERFADSGATPAAPAAQPEQRGFLSAFFSPATPAAAQPKAPRPLIDPTAATPAAASAASPAQPLVQLAATGEPARPLIAQQPAGDANPLPGVRQDSLFEISRRSGLDDDSDIDLHEGDEPPYQLASAAGLARLAPNGLLKQTDHVDVACLKPSLVRVLKTVERHYGRKVVVTSGYRSPDRNRRARGARNSLHMYCAAADVQVEGVSKWDLAQFVRSMPGRGGVGTYCHTDSVHIDVGPERDWNWRCRRRK